MIDLIDRQTAYDVLTEFYHHTTDVQHNALREALNKVPSAERVAHWEKGRCSRCHAHAPFWMMASTYYLSNYCPNCGARMDGEQHE